MDLEISSSLYRNNPKEYEHFIPVDVLKYINENELYEV